MKNLFLKKADYVIAPNEDNLGYAISYGLKKGKGSVVRYGSLINKKHLINPDLRKDKMFFKRELFMDNNSSFMIYVGRLEHVKRVLDLIKIIKNIKIDEIKLLIVGKGSLQEVLNKEIINNNLKKKIFLIGEKIRIGFQNVYQIAHVFPATHTGRALGRGFICWLTSCWI